MHRQLEDQLDVLAHRETWDLSRCSLPGKAAFIASRIIWATRQASIISAPCLQLQPSDIWTYGNVFLGIDFNAYGVCSKLQIPRMEEAKSWKASVL